MTKTTVKEFFEKPEVKELQEIQKRNKYGSPQHKSAFEKMAALAKSFGGDIGEYH